MLGGGEDNLQDLLDAVGAEVGTEHVLGRQGAMGSREQSIVTAGYQQSQEITVMQRMHFETMRRQQELIETLVKKVGERSSDAEESSSKRKASTEISYHPQEPFLFLEESYKIEDDAHEKIDTILRQRLRPINVDPKQYWVKGAFKQVERPIIGAVFLDHILGGTVAESTICKMHDRCAFLELKNFLSKNSGVHSESKKKIRIQDIGTDEFAMGVQTQWEGATTVYEAVDGVFNIVGVEWMVRSYSYSGISMINALHRCRSAVGLIIIKGTEEQRSN
jgi:hypothetical protein